MGVACVLVGVLVVGVSALVALISARYVRVLSVCALLTMPLPPTEWWATTDTVYAGCPMRLQYEYSSPSCSSPVPLEVSCGGPAAANAVCHVVTPESLYAAVDKSTQTEPIVPSLGHLGCAIRHESTGRLILLLPSARELASHPPAGGVKNPDHDDLDIITGLGPVLYRFRVDAHGNPMWDAHGELLRASPPCRSLRRPLRHRPSLRPHPQRR